MRELTPVRTDGIAALERRTFEGLGCVEQGIVVLHGAPSWGSRTGSIELPTDTGPCTVPLSHDEREAPYAVGPDGKERRDLLLSLTDEGDYLCCAWARVGAESPLVGVGVDLCGVAHFRKRTPPAKRDLSLLLFTERERELIEQLSPESGAVAQAGTDADETAADDAEAYAKAVLFGAKEAAFKATSAPLRRWYEHHDERLRYEVRHFVMEEPTTERGTGRNGAAQAAMDAMGITRIAVQHTCVEGMALVTAVALGTQSV